jgi:hypothetical protein
MNGDSSDEDFLVAFEAMEIPGSEFRHRDHIRLAWIYLRNEGLADGAARFCSGFKRYVRHIGCEAKYHETITWFYLALVNERIHRGLPTSSWDEFLAANSDILENARGMLLERYSAGTIEDPISRKVFILPDLARQLA